jgi:hypothetical protein
MWAIPVLIPFLAAVVILVSPMWNITKGHESEKANNRKKFLIFMLSSVVATSVISGLLYLGGSASMYDKEVWSCKIVKIIHEERWTEEESRTRQVASGKDSNGNTTYSTETYYVTETYGPYWHAYGNGNKHKISGSTYNKWKDIWKNEKKTGVHRGSSASFDRSITGGIFESGWDNNFETIYPFADIHRYKNKVRKSPSVFNLGEPTEELVKRYPRPAETGSTSPLVNCGAVLPGMDTLYLRRVNAKLGTRYQIHTILIPLGPNDRHLVQDILTAWQGPNKNELVTFYGHDKGKVSWCEVHSWMDNTTIHSAMADAMMSKDTFDVRWYGESLMKLVPEHWRRKEFEDFDYLKVSIHWGWIMGSVLLSILAVVIVAIVISFKDGSGGNRFGRGRCRAGGIGRSRLKLPSLKFRPRSSRW